jgi:hypothetical protein
MVPAEGGARHTKGDPRHSDTFPMSDCRREPEPGNSFRPTQSKRSLIVHRRFRSSLHLPDSRIPSAAVPAGSRKKAAQSLHL